MQILTIGHSNHPSGIFADRLKANEVTAVVDVRTYPHSRFSPQFIREALETWLPMPYIYLGKELGGRPSGGEFYDEEGHVLYGALAHSEFFISGLNRVLTGVEKGYRIALMCSEGDPVVCHRHLLIGRVLSEQGVEVLNVLRDGTLESYESLSAIESPEIVNTWRSVKPVKVPRP